MPRTPALLQRIRLSPLVCLGLGWLLFLTPAGDRVEWQSLDWRTRVRVHFQPPPDPRVTVVLFEDNTDAAISWPPDRKFHGALVEMMSLATPKVVAFDVILDAEREPVDGQDGDALMQAGVEAAAERGVRVVTAAVTGIDPPLAAPTPEMEGPTRPVVRIEGDVSRLLGDELPSFRPFPKLRSASLYGFADTPPHPDGMRREIPLLLRAGPDVYPSLALQTLLAYYGATAEQVHARLGDAIRFPRADGGEVRIPINAAGRYLLNFRYDHDEIAGFDFRTYSYIDMLQQLDDVVRQAPGSSLPPLKDGIVLVGQVVTGKADAGPTPRSAMSPLVLVHANVIDNVLRGDFVRRAPGWAVWGGAIALSYALLFAGLRASIWAMGCYGVLAAAVYVTVAYSAWNRWSLWLPLIGPLTGFIALQFVEVGRRALKEKRGRDQVKLMFGSYLAPQLVDRMVKTGVTPQLGGHQEEITAYFSDIQGFSGFSEVLPPDRLVELMNDYLTVCTDLVQDQGGTLDKYIGDAVVAMFGAPLPLPAHPRQACLSAIRVQQAIGELRAKWTREGNWPALICSMRARIGLNTGRVIVGNMGSRRRFSYTMMGDDVNLAARMESGAKSWGAYTLCTDATRHGCEQAADGEVLFRPLGHIVVMGRTAAVGIHEVVGLRAEAAPGTLECLDTFARGLEAFHARDWSAAAIHFQKSAALEPLQPGRDAGVKSNPSIVYLALTAKFRADPPAPDWNGVHVMTEK